MTKGILRVVAYHGIGDEDAFSRQVAWIAKSFEPVDHRAIHAWAVGDATLPERAVWLTFDDGHADVIDVGQRVLDRHGVAGTVFICPGLVDEPSPYWWDVADRAESAGLDPRQGDREGRLVAHLKTVPDRVRRSMIADLSERLGDAGRLPAPAHATYDHLLRWEAAGHGIGNHTWDHPCLDRSAPEEQEEQVTRASAWLREHFPAQPSLFAYPNGNRTTVAEGVLRALGYPVAALFDHRLHRLTQRPTALSRLRLDAGDELARARAVVSGAHPVAFRWVERVRALRRTSRRGRAHG
ncbi:polysaccharide deacetylase family protein [Blastococcus sp. SYSU D00868]